MLAEFTPLYVPLTRALLELLELDVAVTIFPEIKKPKTACTIEN